MAVSRTNITSMTASKKIGALLCFASSIKIVYRNRITEAANNNFESKVEIWIRTAFPYRRQTPKQSFFVVSFCRILKMRSYTTPYFSLNGNCFSILLLIFIFKTLFRKQQETLSTPERAIIWRVNMSTRFWCPLRFERVWIGHSV